jgi:hypothetical protein
LISLVSSFGAVLEDLSQIPVIGQFQKETRKGERISAISKEILREWTKSEDANKAETLEKMTDEFLKAAADTGIWKKERLALAKADPKMKTLRGKELEASIEELAGSPRIRQLMFDYKLRKLQEMNQCTSFSKYFPSRRQHCPNDALLFLLGNDELNHQYRNLFGFTLLQKVNYECGCETNKSTENNLILELSLISERLSSFQSLHELMFHFCETALNAAFCEKCDKRVNARQSYELESAPKYLFASMKRGLLESKNNVLLKGTDQPFLVCAGQNQYLYEGVASIDHKGLSASGGHYVSNVKHAVSGLNWFVDDSVTVRRPLTVVEKEVSFIIFKRNDEKTSARPDDPFFTVSEEMKDNLLHKHSAS